MDKSAAKRSRDKASSKRKELEELRAKRAAFDKAEREREKDFWSEVPKNAVVIVTLSHVWRHHEEGEDAELASDETEVFKIPAHRLMREEIQMLERYTFVGPVPASQAWLDFNTRLTECVGVSNEPADEERLAFLGGSLKDCEWGRDKGKVFDPKTDYLLGYYLIEC